MFADLLIGLLFAVLAVPLCAQTARVGRGFGPVYDAAHETTLDGTVQQVITTHATGSPAGMHLLVAGPQGTVDAYIGTFLNSETKDLLRAGASLHIVGATSSLHGKEYYLARQLTVGGHTVTLRSKRGLLQGAHSSHVTRAKAVASPEVTVARDGGIR
jgi:hypothetical protein